MCFDVLLITRLCLIFSILAVTVKSWQHTSKFNFICKKAVRGHAAPGFSVDLPYRGLDSLTVSIAVGKAKQGRQHFSHHREPYVAKTGLCFQNLSLQTASRFFLFPFSSRSATPSPPSMTTTTAANTSFALPPENTRGSRLLVFVPESWLNS